MLLSGAVVAVLAVRVLAAPFSELVSSNASSFRRPDIVKHNAAFTADGHQDALKVNANNNQNITEDINTHCALRICPPQFTSIVENDVCICSRYDVLPAVEKRQDVEQDEAHICAAHVCPPRFGGVIVDNICQCIQLVGLRPTPSTVSTIQSTGTPTVKRVKRQEIDTDTSVAIRQEIVEDEAIICAVRVCPPRFGGVIVDKICQCIQLVGLRPTPSTVSTIQSTGTPTVKRVKRVKRQEIDTDFSVAIGLEIVEDEDIICAVRVCPPRFGAIIIDGVCTCTRFGLPPLTLIERSETAYEDCETPCESGYTGKLFGEYCRCVPPSNDYPFTNAIAITKRQEVDNCFARTCPPRYFSAPDGKGGCDCVQGTKFAPPTA